MSVVVATYRSGGSLRYALESIRNQSYQDFEVIVSADGDPEDSARIVAAMDDARFRHISSPDNSGTQAQPNQRAVNEARGEWIAYLGHDDLWMPWHLETMLAAARRENAAFVHALVLALRPDGAVDVFGPRCTSPGVFDSEWFVPPSGWLHLKDAGTLAGGWRNDPKALRGVDEDLLERFAAHGARMVCSDTPSVMKFVSVDYAAYGPTAVRPQASYFERVTSDPRALERELLIRAARDYARLKFTGRPTPAAAAKTLFHSAGYAVKRLTRDIPVMSAFWRRRYAAYRRDIRRRRHGLG